MLRRPLERKGKEFTSVITTTLKCCRRAITVNQKECQRSVEEENHGIRCECLVLWKAFKQDINKQDLLQPELIMEAAKKRTKHIIFMLIIRANIENQFLFL